MERDIYDEDHEAFRDVVKEFVKRYVTLADIARWDADGEVDRDTMRAAGLHAIATVLDTEAVLIKSSTQKHAHLQPVIDMVTSRINGVVASNRYVVCQYNIKRAHLDAATRITPGRRAPTISPLDDEAWDLRAAVTTHLADLAELGVRRISLGGSLYQAQVAFAADRVRSLLADLGG